MSSTFKSHQLPLAFALRFHFGLERPYYMPWNHVLAKYSNFDCTTDLYTSPDFHVVAEHENTDPSYVDRDDPESSGSDSDFDDFEGSPIKNTQRRRLNADKTVPVPSSSRVLRPRPETLPTILASPITPSTFPKWFETGISDHGDQEPVAGSNATSRTLRFDSAKHRSKIVDFAVAYIKPKGGTEMNLKSNPVLEFDIPMIGSFHVPIIVEGKRAPRRSSKVLVKGVSRRLIEAEGDINAKKAYFFHLYDGCQSLIAIIFSGPYWCFSICSSKLGAEPLTWTKVFRMGSDTHSIALRKIFNAAQTRPEDPASDTELVKFAKENAGGGLVPKDLKIESI